MGSATASGLAAVVSWPTLFWLGGFGPLVIAAAMTLALPESARFARARAAASAPTPLTRTLFAEGRTIATLALWVGCFAAVLALYLLLNWLPLLLDGKGLAKGEASLATMGFHLASVASALVLGALIGRGHRRGPLMAWYGALALALIALAVAPPTFGPVAIAAAAVGFFVSTPVLALNGLAADYYPVVMRGAGAGAAVSVGRLGGAIGPIAAGALLASGAGSAGVLVLLLPVVALAAAATLLLLAQPTTSMED